MTMTTSIPAEEFHGAIDPAELARLGKSPAQVLDLSSSVLAVATPPSVSQAMTQTPVAAYPDRECRTLCRRIAKHYEIEDSAIVVGNGCCELIHLLARAVLTPESRVLVLEPTFSEYRRASELMGAETRSCWIPPGAQSPRWSDVVADRLAEQAIDLVWICNPNNPCGSSRAAEEIEALADRYPATLFAIDESYIEFAESTPSIIGSPLPNVICLRSLTKSHALAGVRLGFAVAPQAISHLLKQQRTPWSVNAVAQAMGTAVLDVQSHYDAAIHAMRQNRDRLVRGLQQRQLQPVETDANFVLVTVDDARQFRTQLLQRDVVVRDCRSFGLDDCVRIAVGDERAVDRCLAALDPLPVESAATATATAAANSTLPPHVWGKEFQHQLHELFRLRRDIRRFRSDPIPTESLQRWIDAACLAPSVGLSQPWRFVSVQSASVRAEIAAEFEQQNALAAQHYEAADRRHYLSLKLAGIREAPEQLAVFVVSDPAHGRGLGRRTMPETVEYSVVAAIQNLWLAARAEGVGVGWVSILDSERVNLILRVPEDYQLIAYLCIGYPSEPDGETPRLERDGWEQRMEREDVWTQV